MKLLLVERSEVQLAVQGQGEGMVTGSGGLVVTFNGFLSGVVAPYAMSMDSSCRSSLEPLRAVQFRVLARG